MSGNGFCYDCPAYWNYDGRELCMYRFVTTREYHEACEAKPKLEKFCKTIDRAVIKGDGNPAIGILGGNEDDGIRTSVRKP